MKILLVIPGPLFKEYGGGEVYALNLVNELLEQKIQFDIVSITSGKLRLPRYSKISVGNSELREYYLPLNHGTQSLKEQFQKILHESNPNVVHANSLKMIASQTCHEESIPCIVTAHHGGICCPQGSMLNSSERICKIKINTDDCLGCVVKNIRGGKYFYPFYKQVPVSFRLKIGTIISKFPFIPFLTPLFSVSKEIYKRMDEWRTILTTANLLIAPSKTIYDALIRNGASPMKTIVLQHGIPLLQKQPLSEDICYRPIRFFYFGRINRSKGLHILLAAFKRLNTDSCLTIIGDAITKEEKKYYSSLKREYSDKNIFWVGNIPHEHVYEEICKHDVMIHPAIFLEVFGLTISEALSAGRPVLSTRCGGSEMQIKDGVNGLLIPPNDVAALEEKMQYIIDHPEVLLELHDNIKQPLSIKEHVHELLNIYNTSKK